MPYIREDRNGRFVECHENAPRAFRVDTTVWENWTDLVAGAVRGRPTTIEGWRLRPYGDMDVASHPPYAPSGIYTDHRDPAVESAAYRLRDRLLREQAGASQATLEPLATEFGLRHWRDAYNTVRNVGRRLTGESGRDANGELRWRRWNSPRNMRHTPAAPARPGARPDGSLVARRFGVEVEYDHPRGGDRSAIVADLVSQGINAQVEQYNHNTRPHWKMTTDATVSGGEIVSPIMAGDTASLDEVRDVIRTVKAHGGTASRSVGMHVHHDVTDFTTPELRARLVDTLQASERAMGEYVLQARVTGLSSHAGSYLTASDWNTVRREVQHLTPGSDPSGSNWSGSSVSRYSFYNVTIPMRKYGTVEFRGLGGTLNPGKVRVWIRMGQALIEAARLGVVIPMGVTSQDLAAILVEHNLLGQQTAARFVAECDRRMGRVTV
jgi:hypothetical protein